MLLALATWWLTANAAETTQNGRIRCSIGNGVKVFFSLTIKATSNPPPSYDRRRVHVSLSLQEGLERADDPVE